MCRAGDILHWEDVDNVEQRGFSWSEPPSEYVELVDSTTGNSVFLVHPGHLRNQNERYVETRKAFGQYVVVNLKKPLREIGVNAELIDRVMTPGEINGQADKHRVKVGLAPAPQRAHKFFKMCGGKTPLCPRTFQPTQRRSGASAGARL